MKRLLPAYPLFVNDPYFSIWSSTDLLNESDTMFWNGSIKKTYGLLIVDDNIYSFLGNLDGVSKLTQVDLSVDLFSTNYSFKEDDFTFDISFISPLVPTDLRLMSRPVCYFTYKFNSKIKHNVKVILTLDEGYTYNTKSNYVIGGAFEYPNYEVSYFGLNRQLPMSQSFDSASADWGYFYITGQKSYFTSKKSFDLLLNERRMEYICDDERDEKVLISYNEFDSTNDFSGKILVAFDDLVSIYYFGEWLRGYYFKDNDVTIFDAIEEAYDNFDIAQMKMDSFSENFNEQVSKYNEDYKMLCIASFRQSIGAHKLVENHSHEILFLSKECHSNGCISTVDITYPSLPLYLLYNPELVLGMLRPIFKFAKKPIWTFDFAPHDAGTYPYCLGQTYGLKNRLYETDRFLSNQFQRNRGNGIIVNHPMIYTFPQQANVYRFESQMPLEECANMIISSYGAIIRGANKKTINDNYDLLYKWVKYLTSNDLVPFNQLCTDDFHSTVDKNVNLSIKTIVALKAFINLSELLDRNEDISFVKETLSKFKTEFYEHFDNVDHLPLSYFGDADSYSVKYNLVYDKVFNLKIFKKETYEKEVEFYKKKNNHFGVNLDSRSDLLKTDWLLYASALADKKEDEEIIYSGAANYLKEGASRVPFTDLYHTETGIKKDFQNRPVQGGIFINLLRDEMNK